MILYVTASMIISEMICETIFVQHLKKLPRDPGSPTQDGKCPVAVPALGYPCAWEFNGDPTLIIDPDGLILVDDT